MSGTIDRFRLATFNVESLGGGGGGLPALDERIRRLRPQLERLDADILCLQEVDGQRGDDGARRLEALDRAVDATAYRGFHRICTVSRSRGGPRDKHNLVILSRWPFARAGQVFHDLVAPPRHRRPSSPASEEETALEWDRPLLSAAIELRGGRALHLLNVHLRAPRASFLEGRKRGRAWTGMSEWAEGFYVAAIKRDGQALEARLVIDRIFDAEPEALIAVCGDFNADVYEVPVRTIRGDPDDAGDAALAARTLAAVERALPEEQRYSVLHEGRPLMLDHILASPALLAQVRAVEVHNEALDDEAARPAALASLASFHAPVVAEFGGG